MHQAVLAAAALALAGCASTFPEGSSLLAEVETAELAAGAGLVHNFTLPAPAGFVAVGFRTGHAAHVHVVLRAPNGTRYHAAAGDLSQSCALRDAAAGAWGLEVAADAFDGLLRGGKFTVRAASGEPPAILPCTADPFPGRDRNATLAAWRVNLAPGEGARLGFEQALDLQRLQLATRGDVASASLTFFAPDRSAVEVANATNPSRGAWVLQVVAQKDAPTGVWNATVAVQGVGL